MRLQKNTDKYITIFFLDLSKALRTRRKAKRENKRKLQECPKDFRSYCLNGGKCRWILSLEKASCR